MISSIELSNLKAKQNDRKNNFRAWSGNSHIRIFVTNNYQGRSRLVLNTTGTGWHFLLPFISTEVILLCIADFKLYFEWICSVKILSTFWALKTYLTQRKRQWWIGTFVPSKNESIQKTEKLLPPLDHCDLINYDTAKIIPNYFFDYFIHFFFREEAKY